MRVAKTIELDARTEWQLLAFRRGVGASRLCLQQRVRIVPLASKDIAVGVGRPPPSGPMAQVLPHRWHRGAAQFALRSGRPASVMAEMESRIVQATLQDRPANATR